MDSYMKGFKPNPKSKHKEGYFRPKFPEKVMGDTRQLIFRSSWEYVFMMVNDLDPDVVKWASENTKIEYRSPLDQRIHRYFPDFYVEKIIDGKLKKFIIEIKPEAYLKRPVMKSNSQKDKISYMKKLAKFAVIKAKRDAAVDFCHKRNLIYQFLGSEYVKKYDIKKLEEAYSK